jgi:hypothetical protein
VLLANGIEVWSIQQPEDALILTCYNNIHSVYNHASIVDSEKYLTLEKVPIVIKIAFNHLLTDDIKQLKHAKSLSHRKVP